MRDKLSEKEKMFGCNEPGNLQRDEMTHLIYWLIILITKVCTRNVKQIEISLKKKRKK